MAQGYAGVPQGPLSAYLGVRDANSQSGAQEVQIAGQLQKIQQQQMDMQEIAQLKAVMAPANGDPVKAQELLLKHATPKSIAIAKQLEGMIQKPIQPIGAGGAIKADGTLIPPQARPETPRAQSIGSGGLRLPDGTIVPPAANPNRPQDSAPVAIVGADGKPVYTTRSGAIGQTPAPRTSTAGSADLSPAALAFTARQYLTGDRQAVQGYARNATARIALQNAIVDEAAAQGLSPEQTAAKMAEFAGTVAGSRTVGQRAANISLAAIEAQEMLGIVKESSDKFGRTNFVPWNQALRAYESGTGSPEIAAFGAAVNALVNVYARAINPTGVPTKSDKEHARAVLNTVQSPAQVDAVLGIIRRELEIAKKAPEQVRSGIRDSIAPKGADDLEERLKKYR